MCIGNNALKIVKIYPTLCENFEKDFCKALKYKSKFMKSYSLITCS